MKHTAMILSVLVVVAILVGCGGGGGESTPPPPQAAFTIKSWAQYGTTLRVNTNQNVTGYVASLHGYPTPIPSATQYDWSVITDGGGVGPIYNISTSALPSSGNGTWMNIWMAPHANCAYGVPTQTSALWKDPGQYIPVYCSGATPANASPTPINVTAPPATVTLTGQNLATQYGTPMVRWIDEFGTVVAQEYAASYRPDGTQLVLNTPTNIGTFYSGPYALVVLPVQADGTYWSQAAARLDLTGHDRVLPPPDPDPDPCLDQPPDEIQLPCGPEN